MKTLKSVIEDIKNLRGADVKIFGQPITLDSEVDRFSIDIIDVLEALADYEIDIAETDVSGLGNFGNYSKADNSYNWNSPISNHFNFETYIDYDTDMCYICFRVHRYGDVRCNYTDDVWFCFDNEYTFYELISETTTYETVEIDGNEYSIDINVFNEGYEVFNEEGDYICTTYENNEADIIADIKNNIE